MTTTILLPLIQALIVYWTTNLRQSPGAFFMFGLIYYLTLTSAQGLGKQGAKQQYKYLYHFNHDPKLIFTVASPIIYVYYNIPKDYL